MWNFVLRVAVPIVFCIVQPFLYLVWVQAQPKRSADDYPKLTKAYVNALCVGPFGMKPCLITRLG